MELVEMPEIDDYDFVASSALIFYEGIKKDRRKEDDHQETLHNLPKNYITLHRIQNGQVCEGRAITKRLILNLVKKVQPSYESGFSYLPPYVIAFSEFRSRLIWWLPACEKRIIFDKSTGIKSGTAPLPALIFFFDGGILDVYALKENSRPAPETELYHSPFFNAGCMGNVRMPKNVKPSDTKKLESLFFGSAFTSEHPPQLKGVDGKKLWISLTGSGEKNFPLKYLSGSGKLGSLMGGARHGSF